MPKADQVNGCPRDADGDGNCGQPNCPDCGTTLAAQQLRDYRDRMEEEQVYVLPERDLNRLQGLLDMLAGPLANYATLVAVEREQVERELTQARDLNNRLTKALAYLVKEWPQTSWAGSNDAHDTAQALLDELAGEGATMGSPDPAPVQENTPHAPSHQDTDRH